MSVAILVPMLGRRESIEPLLASLLFATPESWSLMFLCSMEDTETLAACKAASGGAVRTLTMPFPREHGDYARKINYGVRATQEPWVFQGASDLRFHPEWLTRALTAAERHKKRVIGTNDLGNRHVLRGKHSTHSLVARSYIDEVGTVDEKGKLLHEGYRHNYVDMELVQAALHRGEFLHVRDSVVEHLHPNWGKAERDETYDLALDAENFGVDRMTFRKRQRVWRQRKGGCRTCGR